MLHQIAENIFFCAPEMPSQETYYFPLQVILLSLLKKELENLLLIAADLVSCNKVFFG